MTFVIVGLPPTVNATRRMFHFRRAVEAAEWREQARLVGRATWGDRPPVDPADLIFEFVVPDHRIRDIDGLVGAAKPLIDGLVDAGVLVGDDTRHVRSLHATCRLVPGVREVRITVRAATEDTA